MPKKEPVVKPKFIHIMADGSVRDSVAGYVIPYNEKTDIIFEMIVKFAVDTVLREEAERQAEEVQ